MSVQTMSSVVPLKRLHALDLCTPEEVQCSVRAIRGSINDAAERDNLRFLECFRFDPDPDRVVRMLWVICMFSQL